MQTLLADVVLAIHFALAAYIVAGIVCTWVGAAAGWRWIRAWWPRVLHLSAIGFVAVEALLGIACPLTVWEASLRGVAVEESFVSLWLGKLLYYDLPEWVFAAAYCAAALVTLIAWRVVPPEPRRPRRCPPGA